MNKSSSKEKGMDKYSGQSIGFFTVLAAIVAIIAYVFPTSDKNIEKIRELLEEQKELTVFSHRTEIPDSVLNTNPILKETSELQSKIEQYFRVCDRLSFPSEKELTEETKEIVCIQNLKILIELEDIIQKINQYILKLMLLEPSLENYLDVSGLDKVNETNQQLNVALRDVNTKIGGISNDKERIKIIWKFFNSKELYPALESKKDAYIHLFKACEVVMNKQK